MNCDILTVGTDHVNTEVLEEIATKGVAVSLGQVKRVPVHPSWETLRLVQDRYLQKQHFEMAGLPVTLQIAIDPEVSCGNSLREAAASLGLPFTLKARKVSYDGRWNFN